MKRYGNLFDKICDIENIRLAHKNARKKKTNYKEVKEVDLEPERYFLEIKILLETQEFRNSKYEVFTKKDKGKLREIYKLPYFPDRIIHHAIVQVLEPIWKATLINDTYQSIKGRGIHKAVRKIQKNVYKTDEELWYLQVDISKYYPSINNESLKLVIRKKIKCKRTLALLDEIIDSTVGVPIGNYLSQYFGNLNISNIDHKLKESYNAKMYFRYCDDIVIVSDDKNHLHKCNEVLVKMLAKHSLKLKGNYTVNRIDEGLDFLGVVIYAKHSRLRKRIKVQFRRRVNKGCGDSVLCSYNGWLKMCNGYTLFSKYNNKHKQIINNSRRKDVSTKS